MRFVLMQNRFLLEILFPSNNSYNFLLNVFLMQELGFTYLVSWNQPAWSISTEMFAYLLFPFLISFMQRLSIINASFELIEHKI